MAMPFLAPSGRRVLCGCAPVPVSNGLPAGVVRRKEHTRQAAPRAGPAGVRGCRLDPDLGKHLLLSPLALTVSLSSSRDKSLSFPSQRAGEKANFNRGAKGSLKRGLVSIRQPKGAPNRLQGRGEEGGRAGHAHITTGQPVLFDVGS